MKKQAFNPYLPSYEYVPDGEPRIFGDRIYVYGSHDRFNGPDFCVNDYVCWSAPLDGLGDWRYEGVIYRADQDPKNKKKEMHMNAPDVVQGPDGRYYLYYQLHRLSSTAVAVCDSPAGKYEFYGYVEKNGVPYGETKGDAYAFDPGVLVDDDGRIWLYIGFSPAPGLLKKLMKMRGNEVEGGYCIELEKDMKTVKGETAMVVPGPAAAEGTPYAGHGFYEASSPRKIEGKYYLVYSSVLSHELCYAVSDFPNKGFVYGGTLVSIADIGYQGRTKPDNYTGNTHGGMVKIKDQWYIFYHRQTNKQKCARQGCAEKITIRPDGSIPQVEMTSCGLNEGPLAGTGTYEARIACNLYSAQGTFAYEKTREKDKKGLHPYFTQTGEDREKDPDQYIANLRRGSTAGFKYFEFQEPESITLRVRSKSSGIMEVRTREGGPCVARIEVKASEDWTTASGTMEKVKGILPLYFTWQGEGGCDFDRFTLN